MSLLTPLYLLGLLAVTVPVLLHLFRPTPRGRVLFSAVMFLEETPPKQTRRNRIENWPLLLLRGLALTLLAAAFVRPFLQDESHAATTTGRRLAILIDASASMRRGDLWTQALEQAHRATAGLTPDDELSIVTLSHTTTHVLSREEWKRIDAGARTTVASQRLSSLSPGWGRSDLGGALHSVAADLTQSESDSSTKSARPAEIILISDLAAGSQTGALKTSPLPENIRVRVVPLSMIQTTNAGIALASKAVGVAGVEAQHSLKPSAPNNFRAPAGGSQSLDPSHPADPSQPAASSQLAATRVRVLNAADSQRTDFRLRWVADSGASAGDAIAVHVPPGESRFVTPPPLPESQEPCRLRLEGDDHDFDNEIHFARAETEYLTVLFLGPDEPNDPQGPRFYIERVFPITAERSVQIAGGREAEVIFAAGELWDVPLIVVALVPSEEAAASLHRFAQRGGTVLVVPPDAAACTAWDRITGLAPLKAADVDGGEFALLTDIDFDHPLWQAFREPQFSDFSKIHLWRRRRIELPAATSRSSESPIRVLARFDATDPAVLEAKVGAGRVLLFATGWQPRDSQLAVSSRFAPLMSTLLDLSGSRRAPNRLLVGESIALHPSSMDTAAHDVRTPEGRIVKVAASRSEFAGTATPGIYEVTSSTAPIPRPQRVVVQIPPEESRTEPMPLEQLESLGVKLAKSETSSADAMHSAVRQLHARELEQKQKLWRWLMLTAAFVLLGETWLANPKRGGTP